MDKQQVKKGVQKVLQRFLLQNGVTKEGEWEGGGVGLRIKGLSTK